jgi:hypothetical protein
MKEGQFTFQWTVISLLLLLLIDYYTMFFYVCTIINKNIQLLKLNILVLSLFTNRIFWNRHLKCFIHVFGKFWGSGTD